MPDAWPHVAGALDAAGFDRPARPHREALYGGTLDGVPEPGELPLAGLDILRTAGADGTRFAAVLDGRELGFCSTPPTGSGSRAATGSS